MISRVKVFCVILLTIISLAKFILGGCEIKLSEDPMLRPIIHKYVGLQKRKIHINSNNAIRLREDQKVEAFCDINFEHPRYYNDTNKLYLSCSRKYIHTSTNVLSQDRDYYESIMLQCSFPKWKLYESSRSFKWCPSNATSYILARPKHSDIAGLGLDHEYLGGICYDTSSSTFHSVYYTLASKKFDYAEPFLFGYFYEQTTEIQNIEKTFGLKSPEDVYDDGQFKTWVTYSNYGYSSIIQHHKILAALNNQFSPLLEFLWWQKLRLYNWNRYVDALQSHIENDNLVYDVLAGVSDALEAPMVKNCKNNYIRENVIFNKDRYIPLYIWNYLQDVINVSNTMVVIGFNSPLNEYYSEDDIVFCPDICQDVPWLQEIVLYFRYKITGIVFCCSVEDVISSKRLNDFPEIDLIPDPNELMVLNTESTGLDDDYLIN